MRNKGTPIIRKESKATGKNARLTRNHMSDCSRGQDSESSACKACLPDNARGRVAIPKASREVKMAMSSSPVKLSWTPGGSFSDIDCAQWILCTSTLPVLSRTDDEEGPLRYAKPPNMIPRPAIVGRKTNPKIGRTG